MFTKLHDYMFTRLHDYMFTRLHDYMFTKSTMMPETICNVLTKALPNIRYFGFWIDI